MQSSPESTRLLRTSQSEPVMKRLLFPALLLSSWPVWAQSGFPPTPNPGPLEVVASLDQQPTGVAVSKTGRVFACFPYWTDNHTYSVAELKTGQPPIPYPTPGWNDPAAAALSPADRFVCVQSVIVDGEDKLWALDAAAPEFRGVVNGAKLVKIDSRFEHHRENLLLQFRAGATEKLPQRRADRSHASLRLHQRVGLGLDHRAGFEFRPGPGASWPIFPKPRGRPVSS